MRPYSVLVGFLLVSVLLLVWSYFLRKVWTRPTRLRSFATRASLSAATFIYIFFALELLFYSTIVFSDTFGFTLSSQRWFEKHWGPINSFGYRDPNYSPADLTNKQLLFVLGDSFVAGHGIENVNDRFSNILQKNLGPEYVVMNVARLGWNTADEYQAIVSSPYKPKRIILSYFINDILGAAQKSGFGSPVRVEPPQNSVVRYTVRHSYTFDFAYWRLYRFRHRRLGETYWKFLSDAYANPQVWQLHQSELQNLIAYTQSQQIDLIVVVFPNLTDVKGSAPLTSKVAELFTTRGVRVVNLEPLLAQREVRTMTVNSLDAHPNAALHAEVANLLTKIMQNDLK